MNAENTAIVWRMKKSKKIPSDELTGFTRQLATLTTAGIPLMQGLSILKQNIEKTTLGQLIQKISLHLEKGYPLSTALKQYPMHFNALYCNLVLCGEQSGTLDIMLHRLATYQEKNQSLKRKIRKAMAYPLAVLIIAFSITLLLLLKVVPVFQTVFEGSGTPLPAFTQLLLSISQSLQNHGFIILMISFLCSIFFIQLYRSKKHPAFKQAIQYYVLKIPVLGVLIQQTILARITRTLATTTNAGVPLIESLNTLTYATQNSHYSLLLIKIQQNLKSGQSLHMAMQAFKLFPPMMVQMIKIGECSGTLEMMLDKIATLYEEKTELSIDSLSSLLEPLIMVLLGLIVGGLVIALYLPIFNMGSVF